MPSALRTVTTAALCAVSAASLIATAGPAQAEFTGVCTVDYPDPNVPTRVETSKVSADVTAPGTVTFRFDTTSNTEQAYTQTATVIWANIDTGRNGSTSAEARIDAGTTTLTLPPTETKPGLLAIVAQVHNVADDGQHVSTLDCSAEYTVV
ncbi:hypothetical protein GV794_23215 [Nocardia cyriacigeorgica]|uniref:Uncharacterized protein n=1 Tax=Nocardia cyriacigeorgica TaxID=135487 RepID=A0A6P1D8R9_9NOCA|nr:hypothetical protein [Nocardia cyriacigeorgica]NEW41726.1 hypothetical protein [Nocardia cyriacigeorgica]NEW44642.1 hypothetical protein [Nocardia cyriacigeorgica]NEW51857.1 hypothetical protein [Nocardia cyriacigeorgica]NEW58532.1 hypothetical protein [Nocardia cyriacigeorgica]